MANVHAGPSLAPGQDCLSRLPVELLLRITSQLKSSELYAVRLCSRTLEHALHYFFLQKFFRRRQFMLTELSLQTLLAFAQHPDISQTLRHVSIGVEEFRRDLKTCYPAETKLAITLTAFLADQKALMANGRAVRLLAAAFSLLPNLETVQLRDRDAYTRLGYGPYKAWRSHGLRRTQKQLGSEGSLLIAQSCSPDFSSRAFSLLVAALAQSKARPPNLKVTVDMPQYALNYLAFDLSPAPRLYVQGSSSEDGVDVYAYAVLAALRRVQLRLQCAYDVLESDKNTSGDPSYHFREARAFAEYLPVRAWLAHCPNIQWLSLNLAEEACS
ncbi:hypothetical protein SEPCBS119000_004569 [Sporothrix epigloea]|uniref:F-box domain-containing protein n=1 Tax=Sporothrix epigloea TaxID=1892477 RepID=A0ABP0DST9_9PEZI